MSYLNGKKWQVVTVLPNGTKISTTELPSYAQHGASSLYPFETCIFPNHGSSRVVGQFETKEEAIRSHTFLVGHELMSEMLESTVG
jgi:hypothetical protein